MASMIQMAWPFILMAVIFYAMIYRPQKRDQRKREQMLNSLKPGTRIVTIGGILGVITKVQDDKIRIKVAEGVEIHIRKTAVGGVLSSAFDKDTKAEDKKAAEKPAEEAKVEEVKAEEPKAEEAKVEEAGAEETKSEEEK